MLSLVYTSQAAQAFDDDALHALLGHARTANAGADVTGMLLFAHGGFLQHLEGPPERVEDLFERILADDRHADVHVLERGPVDRRAFTGWAMGFDRPADARLLEVVPGFKAAVDYPLVDPRLVRHATIARTLLTLYARNP